MPMRDKVRIQFMTFESIKRNFHKVFRNRNDSLAEMLFRYLSNSTDDSVNTVRVNYFDFLKKFDVIWPKKVFASKRRDESTKEN
jgi:hypothetical protein